MGKTYKITTILLFVTIIYVTNLWAIGLIVSFIFPLLSLPFKKNTWEFLICLLIVMSMVTKTYGFTIFFTCILLIYRILTNDRHVNKKPYFVIFLIMMFGSYNFYNNAFPIIYISFLLTVPIPSVELNKIRNNTSKALVIPIMVVFILSYIYSFNFQKNSNNVAYLHHGVWALASEAYDLNNLRNSTSYSYSEFVKLLQADTISSIENIKSYDELWIVTPTTPFSQKEISDIKKWVAKGGRLVLVSDHTDLYGHARCVNQIANEFNVNINYSATFPNYQSQKTKDAFGNFCNIKTGTNATGFMFPSVSAWMWEEDAYYANENFFGPLSPSKDDSYGNKILMGHLSYGLGQICFLQDSTPFANFSVYQPHVLQVAKIARSMSFLSKVYVLLPLLLICIIILYALKKEKCALILSLLPILLFSYSSKSNFNFGNNPQIWTGDPSFLEESGCPYANIATAYSLSSLSERKPIWVDDLEPESNDDVIWVDSTPPLNNKWRWVHVSDTHTHIDTFNSKFNDFFKLIKAQNPSSVSNLSYNYIKANNIVSDNVMNDWWYNGGISAHRANKFKSWIAWLNQNDTQKVDNEIHFSDSLVNSIVHIDKMSPIELKLPYPTATGDVYLGYGISGYCIIDSGKVSILGLKEYSENSYSPRIWAIEYK